MANDIYTASEDELKRIRNKKREILARADEVSKLKRLLDFNI